jgi:hypothetical protein
MSIQQGRRTVIYAVVALIVVGAGAFATGVAAETSWAHGPRGLTLPVSRTGAGPVVHQRVSVYGDSLANQSKPYSAIVGDFLGLTVTTQASTGAAPCNSLPQLQHDLADNQVDLVVWAFSGNSLGTCMLDRTGQPLTGAATLAKYRSDTEAAIDAASKAHVLFVLASPPAPRSAGDVWEQLDAVYRQLAVADPAIQYADAGTAIAPDGQFLATQRCLPFENMIPQARQACDSASGTITVRSWDGTHFCSVPIGAGCTAYSSGAMRYAINLLSAARLELDYQTQLAANHTHSP